MIGVLAGAGGCAAFGQIVSIKNTGEAIRFNYAAMGDGPCFCDLRLPIFAIVDKSDLSVAFNEVGKGPDKEDLSYEHFFMYNCQVYDDADFVIRTQGEWDSFIGYFSDGDKTDIGIDFDEQMVLGVVRGVGGCAGLGQIENISEDIDSVLFEYNLGAEGYCDCWILVSIFAIVEKSALPVEFSGPIW